MSDVWVPMEVRVTQEFLDRTDKMYKLEQETHPERLWVLERIPQDAFAIYDLGCGKHKTIPAAIGIDIGPVTDITASIDYLSMLQNCSADVLISRHSLEHILDVVKTLKEWLRVLKVGGLLIIILPWHGALDTMCPLISMGTHLHAFSLESFLNLISLFEQFEVLESGVVVEGWSFGVVIKKLF